MKNTLYVALAVVCLLLWVRPSIGQKTSPARQTWEYKAVVRVFDVKDGVVGAVVELLEDGKDLPIPGPANVAVSEPRPIAATL